MKIRSLSVMPLVIPFVEQFAHAAKTREASDAILFKVELGDGTVGWGETLVRPYLTGETVSSLAMAAAVVAPGLAGLEWRLDWSAGDPLARLAPLTSTLTKLLDSLPRPASVRAWNGLRCGLELGILDALLRAAGRGLSELLPPERKEVVYSGVITAGDPAKSLKAARHMRQLGITSFKLKVQADTAASLVRDVRELIGASASLRLDANAAFSLGEAIAFCRAVEPHDIAAIEEPLAQRGAAQLAELQRATSIAVMVDESLVTAEDADELVSHQAARMFNLRLAKCGGFAGCLELARKATAAGIGVQLGALVGETAILSAAGRALAAHCGAFRFVEGSYGTLLLKEDVARQSIRFGHGGKAPLLRGKGLAIDIDEAVVAKFLERDLVQEFAFST